MKQALLRVVLKPEEVCKKIVAGEEWEVVNRVLVLAVSAHVHPVELLHLTRQEYPVTK
jgi:hypothetical protein